jgi:crotonobetainyl-CoA:carnitine CoA-transferase CaiB-like acyl-CoA transferase
MSPVEDTPRSGDAVAPRPFERLRVLEVGRHLGIASAGLHLAALGADVVQVRHAGRSVPAAESAYYDRGRRVVEPGAGAAELGAAADVILTDLPDAELAAAGLPATAEQLRGGPGPAVLVTIRSLGRTGPNRDFRMTDLTEWAATGLATITRRPRPADSDEYVPVLPPGCQPQALAGLAAATAALAGRRLARRGGEPVVADVSVQEVVAAMLHGIFPQYLNYGIVMGHPSTPSTALGLLLPAADGDVYLRTLDPRQWDAVIAWVGDDTLAAIGGDADSRLANHDVITTLLGEWTAGQRRQDLVEEGQRHHIPIALPRSVDDVLAWQHLRARGVWRSVELDGRHAVVPRVPLLEPAAWRVSERVDAAAVAERWRALS